MIAEIASGKVALAEVMFLVAFIVFCLGAYFATRARAEVLALICIGLAATSLGWLLL